ncbi:pectinesterase inhibitor 9-like [Primulina eburnea]|uniref:pectinesterase inhibitor 9-like n=1 Tax=Primulina eburnea TaxID=1245227 RepID=UPI003C6C35FB
MKILSLAFLVSLLPALSVAASAAFSASSSPSMSPKATDFILTSCNTTRYPERCYNTLAGYSDTVHQDPALLARPSIFVSFFKIRSIALYVGNLSLESGASTSREGDNPRASAAVHDCFTLLSDAVDQLRGSLRQMVVLNGSSEDMKYGMINVRTKMSAALTNDDTCTDGFEEMGDEPPVKADVCHGMVEVKEVTSNALALVNNFVKKMWPTTV